MHLSLSLQEAWIARLETLHRNHIVADRTIRRPIGILDDVSVQVGKVVIPCKFIVIDTDKTSQVTIILGRPFLATAGLLIDI